VATAFKQLEQLKSQDGAVAAMPLKEEDPAVLQKKLDQVQQQVLIVLL
jgi:hypothetical protein